MGMIVVVAILAAGYAVTRVQSDEQIQREYLDGAIDVTQAADTVAGEFTTIITDLENFERPTMVSSLQDLQVDMEAIIVDLSELVPPEAGSPVRAHVLLEIAVEAWDLGLTGSVKGVLTLTEIPLDPTGLAFLTKGLVDLQVGDSAYRSFLETIEDVDTSILETPFSSVHFVPPGSELIFEPTDIARRLFLTESLGATRNIAIADLALDPSPVGEDSGIPVVSLSETISAFITISNRGNVDVSDIEVELNLVSNEGDSFGANRVIDALAPGELRSLLFEDLQIQPGRIYEIIVILPQADDISSDNRASFVFMMNEDV